MTSKVNSKDKIYADLKNQIVYCELLPGALILEEDLCKKYQVSRTPVREALLELKREGYITVESRKSTKVSRLSALEIKQIMETRLLVEPVIMQSLNGPLPQETLAVLDDLLVKFSDESEIGKDQVRTCLQADYEFHAFLVSLSGNQILTDFCCSILERSIRYWYLTCVNLEGGLRQKQKQHIKLINLLREENYQAAAKELEKHIRAYYECTYLI